MLPQTGLTGTTSRLSIDIRRFPWIRRIAADYAYDYSRLGEFFAGNPADVLAWDEAIARAQRHQRARNAVADAVHAQQRRRGAPPEAMSAAAQLRDPDTVAVVTGQQAGLFGGPLFTLLKALNAIRLAQRVRTEHRVPSVAVFWIDSEDHDWDEVKTVGVFAADLRADQLSLGDPPGAHEGPVAGVKLDGSVTAALAALEATLPGTEFTPGLLETLRKIYRPGAGMADAFGQWLETVLGPQGLILYDAADPSAKPLVANVFTQEIEHAGETSRLAADAGAALQARGYHAQVTPHEGSVALFHLDGGREPIRRQDGWFQWGQERETKAELLARVKRAPHEFSPNVLLRSLMQDTLFPTVCYVAGPNELAYLGQLGGIYEAFGLPRPLTYLRGSATLLDSNAMRFLAKHDFPLEALRAQDEAALNQLLEAQLPHDVDASLEDAAQVVEGRMEAVAAAVSQIDTTLEGAARSTLGRMQDDLKRLHTKIIQACKRKDETLRRQFKHAQAQAFPGGQPQEREIGFVSFLNKYGPGLVDRLSDEMPLEMGSHWVITI
ncbi:MAG TPA: bacillithiol biosynthesis cysteine-adding enzyme BshC [Vicinamibacterales bacterium]